MKRPGSHALPEGRRDRPPPDGRSASARVAVRVKPGASRTKVGGVYGAGEAAGRGDTAGALVIAVTQRAVDGKATEAALRALAQALGVARGKVRLLSGITSRDKVVEVLEPPTDLADRVNALRAG